MEGWKEGGRRESGRTGAMVRYREGGWTRKNWDWRGASAVKNNEYSCMKIGVWFPAPTWHPQPSVETRSMGSGTLFCTPQSPSKCVVLGLAGLLLGPRFSERPCLKRQGYTYRTGHMASSSGFRVQPGAPIHICPHARTHWNHLLASEYRCVHLYTSASMHAHTQKNTQINLF